MLAFNMKNLSGDRYLNMLYSGLVDMVGQISPILFLWLQVYFVILQYAG